MRIPRIPYWPLLLGPWLSLGLGFLLNFVVMGVNNGWMPVQVPGCTGGEALSQIHRCMAHADHLKFLADWLVIRGLGIASIGDVFEWAYQATQFPAMIIWLTLILKDHQDGRL